MKFVSLQLLDGTVCEVPLSVFKEIQSLRKVANDAMEEEEEKKDKGKKKDMGHGKKKKKLMSKEDIEKEDEDTEEDKDKKDAGKPFPKDPDDQLDEDHGYDVSDYISLQAQNDALKAKLSKYDSLEKQDKFNDAVSSRVELLSKASQFLGKPISEIAKHDSITVKQAVIKKTLGINTDGKQKTYIDAMFDVATDASQNASIKTNLMDKAAGAVEKASKEQKSIDSLVDDMGGVKPPEVDKTKLNSYLKNKEDAWKMPLHGDSGVQSHEAKLKGKEMDLG